MKTRFFKLGFCLLIAGAAMAQTTADSKRQLSALFTENKGQVSDQFYHPRPDVLFSGNINGMTYHLRNSGVSYQLQKVERWKKDESGPHRAAEAGRMIPDLTTIYRLDIDWLNMNPNTSIATDAALKDYDNFYLEVCPEGVTHVRSYTGVTYRNVYPQIDLHYYQKDGHLKYDFLVAPRADYRTIRLQVKGAEAIILEKDGSVTFKTPLGTISEGAPLVYQAGRQLQAAWKLDGTMLGFDIRNCNPALPLVIDPAVRIWGTYYGGPTGYESGGDVCNALNSNGDVYMSGTNVGTTGTYIATSGSHQTTIGGYYDAYLVKFNNLGVRQWGTYYGGAGEDRSHGCAAGGNDVYLVGHTQSTVAIATPSAYQSAYTAYNDAFVAKFDANGVRQWGTYYGGESDEVAYGCAIDANGDFILSGFTSSTLGIASSGAYQQTYGGGFSDFFMARFTSAGSRIWGTYFGGSGTDICYRPCRIDASGNIYFAGWTSTPTSSVMTTAAAHQTVYNGGTNGDGLLAKFTSSGSRVWSSYYGGTGSDMIGDCALDNAGNLFIAGYSESFGGTFIATVGSHQATHGGGTRDCFLAKFNNAGVRQWGTYYGGTDTDDQGGCETDSQGHVYLFGATNSTNTSVIATAGSHQSVNGGFYDGFIAEFDGSGVRQWGSYYGGTAYDPINDVSIDQYGTIYASGFTTPSTSGIATPGSHQDMAINSTGYMAYLVRFNNNCSTPPAPANASSAASMSICATNTTQLSVSGSGRITWYSSATSTTALGTGTAFATPSLSTGTYTYYAEAYTCTTSATRAAITVAVSSNTAPVISAASGSICQGSSFTISPSGASTYTYSGGQAVVSPTATSSYSVTGTSSASCLSSNVAVVTITVNSVPTISISSGTVCSGKAFTLSPSGAATYVFLNGGAQVTPTTTTSYSVTGTSSLGCAAGNTAVATVSVFTSPTLGINSGSVCSGQSFSIALNGVDTYTFLNGASTVTPGVTTSYSVVGTSTLNGCVSNTAVTTITVSPSPTLGVASGSICFSQSITVGPFGAGTGGTYTIAPGGSFNVSPSTSTTYSVVGTSSAGCLSANTATATITVYTLPVVSAAGGAVCSGKTFTFSVSGAGTYSINGVASTNYTVNPAATGSYSITGTSTANCASSNTAIVTVTVNITPTVAVNSGSICAGQIFTVVPSGAGVYSVNGGGTFTFSPSGNTAYSVTGTSTAGCVAFNTAVSQVTVVALPAIGVNSGSVCAGQVFTFAPSGAASYSLNNAAVTVFTLSPSTSAAYSVSGTSSVGCVSSAPAVFSITVYALPSLSVNSGSLCAGQVFTLAPLGAAGYSVNGVSTTVFTVSPAVSTSYSVTGASAEGCVSSAQAVSSVTVNALPTVTISSSATLPTVCVGDMVVLTAGGASTYAWSSGTVTSASISVQPVANTIYTVTGLSAAGCANTATLAQFVDVCLGVTQALQDMGVTVYPNPNEGRFTIGINAPEQVLIQVHNALGQLIHESSLSAGAVDIDISHYSGGIYFVSVFNGEHLLKTQKVVKQ